MQILLRDMRGLFGWMLARRARDYGMPTADGASAKGGSDAGMGLNPHSPDQAGGIFKPGAPREMDRPTSTPPNGALVQQE